MGGLERKDNKKSEGKKRGIREGEGVRRKKDRNINPQAPTKLIGVPKVD